MSKDDIYILTCEEHYPTFTIAPASSYIGGTANGNEGKFPLTTLEDVLKMHWLEFVKIPEDKLQWMRKVENEYLEAQNYLRNLQPIQKKHY